VKNCPSNALKPAKNGIRRDGAVCNGCGACAALCPAGAMEPIGSIMTSGAVAKRVLEDAPFFKESSGGVTVSGGEPTAQKDFLYETLWRIKENGIHTAIETCGLFSRETLRRLAPVTDLFLFDIKHVDGLRHEASTGVRPEMILSNFGRIVADYGCEKVIPRIPLIPGFNTDDDSIAMIAAFLHGAGYSGIVHILPYNCLSKQKYEKLGRTEQFIDRGTMEESRIESIRTSLQRQSFQVYCNN
jgi:pyruvate formate lyase activating enzyme